MKYQHIVFMHGQDADEAIDILCDQGTEAAFEYLLEYDSGECEETDTPPWGTKDHLYRYFDGEFEYVMSVNCGLPYVGLCKEVE